MPNVLHDALIVYFLDNENHLQFVESSGAQMHNAVCFKFKGDPEALCRSCATCDCHHQG